MVQPEFTSSLFSTRFLSFSHLKYASQRDLSITPQLFASAWYCFARYFADACTRSLESSGTASSRMSPAAFGCLMAYS